MIQQLWKDMSEHPNCGSKFTFCVPLIGLPRTATVHWVQCCTFCKWSRRNWPSLAATWTAMCRPIWSDFDRPMRVLQSNNNRAHRTTVMLSISGNRRLGQSNYHRFEFVLKSGIDSNRKDRHFITWHWWFQQKEAKTGKRVTHVVEQKPWWTMAELADGTANRFHIFLAHTLHQCFNLLLCDTTTPYQLWMYQKCVILPTCIQTVPMMVRKHFDNRPNLFGNAAIAVHIR